MNVFSDFNVFKAQNDTLFTIPLLIDIAVFKATNFNFAFARYLSLLWVLAYIAFAILAIRIIYVGYARVAAILLLSLPLAINGYWDDGTYIAYHQGLPLVFCMASFYFVLCSLQRNKIDFWWMGIISLLGIFSGLTYISGFVPVLGVGCALLMGAFFEKKEKFPASGYWCFGLFLIFLALCLLGLQFFLVGGAQGSLLEKSHASPVVMPLDSRFWIFFIGVIGKGFGFRGNSVVVDALIAAFIFSPLLLLAFKILSNNESLKDESPHKFLLIAYVYSSVVILLYAAMVAYGRGGLLPLGDINLASTVAKGRFHHWWISALAPFLISGVVWICLSKFVFRYLSFLIFIASAVGLVGLYNSGLWNYKNVFSLQKSRELRGIDCVRESWSLNKVLCKDFYPADIKYAIDLVDDKGLWIGEILRGVDQIGGWRRGSIFGVTEIFKGGHVDFIEVSGENVKIVGWIPLNSGEKNVGLYVDRKLRDIVVSDYEFEVIQRPDVAKVLGDDGLMNSGFSIKFKTSHPISGDVVKKNFCVYGVSGVRAIMPAYADGYYCR